MEDLPLGRIAALVPEFAVKDLPLGRTLMMIIYYITKGVHKERTFRHTKVFFNNNTKTEYTSYGTYLCVLFHIVAFDIKAFVVPGHQFVYTLAVPCGRLAIQPGHDSILQVFFIDAFGIKAFVVQLLEATFQHHTEHQKPMIGCNKTDARTLCTNVLYFLDGPWAMLKNCLMQLYDKCLNVKGDYVEK